MAVLNLLSFINDALYDALPYAIVCLGILWTAKYIRFPDLTCCGTFVLGGAVAAIAIVKLGWPAPAATLLAVLAGAAGGLLTAMFYLGLRMDRILSGILSAFVLYSINLLLLTPTLPYGDSGTLFSMAERLDRQIATPPLQVGWHPWVILIFCGFVLAVKLLMDVFLASEMGLAFRALEDEEAGDIVLLRQGLSPSMYRMLALTVGNGVIGLAGALVSFKENAANANRGFDVLITGLIAFLIGIQIHKVLHRSAGFMAARSFRGAGLLRIRFTTAVAAGAVAYFGLITLSQRVEIDPSYAKILLAALVAISVADVDGVLRRRSTQGRRSGDLAPDKVITGEFNSADSVLSVRDLRFRYPLADTETIRGVSFSVGRGQFVRLRGGNGSGKTTTMRLIAGFLDPQNGSRIIVQGNDLTGDRRGRLRQIAYVDQNAKRGVVGVLTTQENLALAACGGNPSPWRRALTRSRTARLSDVLAKGGMPRRIVDLPADHLSGGERQILNLLTLLAREQTPGIVFLDEPANNLDVANQERCRRIIETLRESGVSVVWISHTELDGMPSEIEIDMDKVNGDGHLGFVKSGITSHA
jgi:putative ABC transport system permease protein